MKKILLSLLFAIVCHSASASFPVKKGLNDCDNIIMQDGSEISAKVLEITPSMIKYRLCNQSEGPVRSVGKDEVFMIKYSNGYKEKIEHQSESFDEPVEKEEAEKSGGFGVAAFILGILGFFVPYTGLLAIIFGAIGLGKNRKSKILAGIGLALGLANLVLVLILLA